jgi:selenocysteine lyase/cysteine desulfurase
MIVGLLEYPWYSISAFLQSILIGISLKNRIYLDFNASTPVAPEVQEPMQPFIEGIVGIPSNQYWAGQPYKEALSVARKKAAHLISCDDDEVIFTSGGSESNNFAIKGAYISSSGRGKHVVTSMIEHPSVIGPCEYLRKFGAEITYVSVDKQGRIDQARASGIRPGDVLLKANKTPPKSVKDLVDVFNSSNKALLQLERSGNILFASIRK